MKKALILAFVSVLIAGVILSGGCGDGGGRPEGVLQKFLGATAKKDFDTMKALVTVQDRQLIEEEEKRSSSASTGDMPSEYKIGESKIEGDTATVQVTFSLEEQKMDIPFRLVKENGEWKVNFSGTVGPQ